LHPNIAMAWRASRDGDRIALSGELRARDARAVWQSLRALSRVRPQLDRLEIDLSGVTFADGRVMALLVELRAGLTRAGTPTELVDVPSALQPLVALFGGDRPVQPRPPPSQPERRTLREWFAEPLSFVGELVEAVGQVLRAPARADWRGFPSLVERAGADAIAIVLLLDFLVGVVIALQAMRQLEGLGASLYVADLVGISVARELAPLMTAIIMSGRSGAAYAAELGTMHVTEEIDALRTMGISPVPYLVIPRVLALALVAPALVLLGEVAAVFGGLIVAVVGLELNTQSYLSELRVALVPSDVWTGVIKSVTFAIAIGLIGCQEGLAARGAAAGVGRRTTATVVSSLFAVVVLDAALTLLFRVFDV
jgi:phospholipid/cholesterol/gamma-HCH transport system permease protein